VTLLDQLALDPKLCKAFLSQSKVQMRSKRRQGLISARQQRKARKLARKIVGA
jgi:hypothetical protein